MSAWRGTVGVLFLTLAPLAATSDAASRPWAARWLNRALDGASERLRQAECQRVLEEFVDGKGRRLDHVLAAQGLPAHAYLRRLHFFEGSSTLCRDRRMAVTAPGSRVIFICSPRFQAVAQSNGAYVEAAIIHEALHSLGLGEDPPTSAFITERVLARCVG
jgi:hypothetical protein